MSKKNDRRVAPPNELGRKAHRIQAQKEADGAQVIPMSEWRYYSSPKVGRIYRATLSSRKGTNAYGKVVTDIPFGDLHFNLTQTQEIVAIGRRFDLTCNDSVRAWAEPKGMIPQMWVDVADAATPLRWTGADETADGLFETAMATLAGKAQPAKEPAQAKERPAKARKPKKTTRMPSPSTLARDPAPLEG